MFGYQWRMCEVVGGRNKTREGDLCIPMFIQGDLSFSNFTGQNPTSRRFAGNYDTNLKNKKRPSTYHVCVINYSGKNCVCQKRHGPTKSMTVLTF
jgi:hypothetical protein